MLPQHLNIGIYAIPNALVMSTALVMLTVVETSLKHFVAMLGMTKCFFRATAILLLYLLIPRNLIRVSTCFVFNVKSPFIIQP